MAHIETGRMGVKGHVVMPQSVREKLGADKGSLIAWVITDEGYVIVRTLEPEVLADESEFTQVLKSADSSFEEWRAGRAATFAKAYPDLAQKYSPKPNDA